ncbi:MAG: YncE family protein [Rhodanobacteraceae bacterium]
MRGSTKYLGCLGLLAGAVLLPVCATASPPFQLDSLQTKDLRLLYAPNEAYLAPYVARAYENSLQFQERLWHWTPWEPTTVVLTDLSDYGNAGTSVSPDNKVIVFIAPDDLSFETSPGRERMFMTFNHELVHVATMDGWNQRDAWWRRFFGGKPHAEDKHPETILYNYLTVPRTSVPRWYLEGIAVFMETWMAGGVGRAQGGYDEMVFRAMVRDHAHFYSPLGLASKGVASDFQDMSNAYLYGTRFISYLALKYSPQKVIQWYSRSNDSKSYYASQFKHVFHLPLGTAWNDWIAWEHTFQRANLHKVRKYPLTRAKPLTSRALGSVSRSYFDPANDTLIGAFRYPGVLPHVGVLSLATGKIHRLVDIKGTMTYDVASTAWDPASGTFFFTQNNVAHRDLMEVNVRTGKTQMLLKGARIGDLAFDRADRSLWGLRHDDGYVTLVHIPYPYRDWKQVHTWPYGEDPFDLDVSRDGSTLSASVAEIDGSKYLRLFKTADLLAGKVKPFAQYSFGQAMPEGFVFTADGRYLYGSSYYTGISNIFRYDIATGKMDAVSNAETGFFRPIPLPDGNLIVLEYTGQGFRPVEINPVPLQNLSAITFLGTGIADKRPIVRSWGVGSPSKVPLQSMITHKGKYIPSHQIRPAARYPVVESYLHDVALGWHFGFADPLGLYSLGVTAAVSGGESSKGGQRLHLDVDYQGMNWYAHYWHNHADFYDLFGPVLNSLKGDSVLVGYKRALILDLPRRMDFSASAAYYTGLNTVPGAQNVSFNLSNIFATNMGLTYNNRHSSGNAVDRESGWDWSLDAQTFTTGGTTVPQLYGGFDFGFMLPLPHASIWMYNWAGASGGKLANPLASFYFGSFEDNYVDDHDPKQYREYDSFPGFGIDALAGQSFAKSTLELNLPPWRFEEAGSPGFFLQWLRPALFGGVLVTDPRKGALRATYRDAGFQLDLRFRVLSHLPMTLSAGYAWGFGGQSRTSREWMLSLKIL